MSLMLPISAQVASLSTPWRRHLAVLGFASAAILILFAGDAAHMGTIWWTSSTFNHCLLILPIIAWLAWQRAPAAALLSPSTWAPGLVLVGTGAMSWMLGDAGGVSLFRHFGLVVSRLMMFPLFYALFIVPAGEEFVPILQGVTAKLSTELLGLAGIPAHMEGVFITTPGGEFEVAEACSGVKFLVAMFALGVLIAHLGFRSWTRRIAFMAAAMIVPVLANGVRAFATIYVASKTSNEEAAGFDHVVYGWFFFGIIIAALMGMAWRFFDRGPNEPFVLGHDTATTSSAPWPVMLALVLTLAASPLAWSASASATARAVHLPPLSAPEVPGWSHVDRTSGVPWSPRFAGADNLFVQRYRDEAGREVDLAVAAYAWQAEGHELVGYGQGAVAPDSGWSWSESATPPPHGRADLIVAKGVTREVLSFYRVGGVTTGNDAEVKVETLKARLFGRSQAAAAILVSSEAQPGGPPPRAAIDAFRAALGSATKLAERATGV